MPYATHFHAPGILLSIAVTIPALTAHAQPEVPAQQGALVIWDAALVAMDNHDYAAACPKIEEVIRLRPDGLGAKLKLAECYEGAGRLASAWRMYLLIEPLAEEANQPDRKKTAHDRAAALRPKLATVTIVVPDAVRALPGLEIKCDDKVVEPAETAVSRIEQTAERPHSVPIRPALHHPAPGRPRRRSNPDGSSNDNRGCES